MDSKNQFLILKRDEGEYGIKEEYFAKVIHGNKEYKVGERVTFSHYIERTIDGKEYVFVKEEHIMAIL